MAHHAKNLIIVVSCAGAACAAAAQGGASAAIDADRSCLAARWHQPASTAVVEVAATNGCGRPLSCDAHLTLATLAGPDLILACKDRLVPVGNVDAICRWDGQPAVTHGSGSLRCR